MIAGGEIAQFIVLHWTKMVLLWAAVTVLGVLASEFYSAVLKERAGLVQNNADEHIRLTDEAFDVHLFGWLVSLFWPICLVFAFCGGALWGAWRLLAGLLDLVTGSAARWYVRPKLEPTVQSGSSESTEAIDHNLPEARSYREVEW